MWTSQSHDCKRLLSRPFATHLIASSLLKDYEVAASYFRQLAPFYAKGDWSGLELITLDLYAQCLRHLERNDDYIRIGLMILAKTARSNSAVRQQPQINSIKLANILQPPQSAAGSLSEILSASKLLKEQIPVTMDTYFDRIDMGMYVRHSPDDDGFQFPLVLRSLLPESFLADSVRVQILSVKEDQRSELWLYANGQNIETGTSRIWLRSNVSRFVQLPVFRSLMTRIDDVSSMVCPESGHDSFWKYPFCSQPFSAIRRSRLCKLQILGTV